GATARPRHRDGRGRDRLEARRARGAAPERTRPGRAADPAGADVAQAGRGAPVHRREVYRNAQAPAEETQVMSTATITRVIDRGWRHIIAGETVSTAGLLDAYERAWREIERELKVLQRQYR